MKILEKKIMDELGPEACARMPPNLRIVEPEQPNSGELSASSSRTSSDVESDAMEEENDENQRASTSGTMLNSNNLKEEPPFDNKASFCDQIRIFRFLVICGHSFSY